MQTYSEILLLVYSMQYFDCFCFIRKARRCLMSTSNIKIFACRNLGFLSIYHLNISCILSVQFLQLLMCSRPASSSFGLSIFYLNLSFLSKHTQICFPHCKKVIFLKWKSAYVTVGTISALQGTLM